MMRKKVKREDPTKENLFINNIKDNYQRIEEDLVTQLNLNHENHQLTAGTNREQVWEDLFRRIVPKKFNVERSVFIIDSYGKCSKEVDIAIYDESYTPYIFNYGVIKFIPVEAVAAVVQCKSYDPASTDLEKWRESIDRLKTSGDSIVRMAKGISTQSAETQTGTKPIKLLCYMAKTQCSSSDNDSGENKNATQSSVQDKNLGKNKNGFDITMIANLQLSQKTSTDKRSVNIYFSEANQNLWKIFERYNLKATGDYVEQVQNGKGKKESNKDTLSKIKIEDYRIKPDGKHNLLSFIFQFNQMLMLINNPMFFPHRAYVNMFNGKKPDHKED